MLEEKDLKKIRGVIHEEIQVSVRKEIAPLRAELGDLIDKKLNPIKQDIAEIRKDVKGIVAFFDSEYLGLRSRVERIEEHLNLKSQSRN